MERLGWGDTGLEASGADKRTASEASSQGHGKEERGFTLSMLMDVGGGLAVVGVPLEPFNVVGPQIREPHGETAPATPRLLRM